VWAAAHPESFASAVMICSGIPIGYRWHAIGRLHRVPLVGWLAAVTPRRLGFRTVMGRYEPQLPRQIIDRSSPPFSVERFAPVLAELNRPALVIWGALNRFVLVEQAERQRESFPRAEVIVLENSRHYPQLDNPVATAAAVIPFLKAQLSSRASI
jgi:pimeloyl-ACP methyl ester carboxylesterase